MSLKTIISSVMKRITTPLLITLMLLTPGFAKAVTCSADFTVTISGATASFDGTATGVFPFFNWDFGDGSYGFEEDVIHTYASDGIYLVCLTVYTPDSCIAVFCDSIFIDGAGGGGIDSSECSAAFTWYESFGAVYFTNTSDDGGAADVNWQWNFGDGTMEMSEDPVHTYLPGTYTVCLSMITSDSCTSAYCETITVGGGIDTGFCSAGFEYVADGEVVEFYNTSTGGGADILWYSWNFGDGTTSTAEDPEHAFPGDGIYYVCLSILTADSCTSAYCEEVVIGATDTTDGVCEAYFTYDFGITPWGIFTINLSDDGGTGDASYSWDFGDGSTSTEEEPIHNYAIAGSYNVCLTISTDSCEDTYCTVVDIAAATEDISLTELTMFPNPARDVVQVQYHSAIAADAFVQLSTITGQAIRTLDVPSAVPGNNQIALPVQDIGSGMYLLTLRLTDGSSMTQKLLVVR